MNRTSIITFDYGVSIRRERKGNGIHTWMGGTLGCARKDRVLPPATPTNSHGARTNESTAVSETSQVLSFRRKSTALTQDDHSALQIANSATAAAIGTAGRSAAFMRLHGIGSMSIRPSKFVTEELGDDELKEWAKSSKSAARALGLPGPSTRGQPGASRRRRSILSVRPRAFAPAPGATYNVEHLSAELEVLLNAADVSLKGHEPLPMMMDRAREYGIQPASWDGKGESRLDANQFEMWRERVARWLLTCKKMNELGMTAESSALHREEDQTIQEMLQPLLQRCTSVTSVSLRYCALDSGALTSACQVLKERLLNLDLEGTLGFDEVAVKTIAVYCTQVDSDSHACESPCGPNA
jgi:hypothetical protein